VPPVWRLVVAGESERDCRVGADAEMVTLEVSALVPPLCFAMTRKVPVVVPAV
jgi:hypothetical protein